MATETLDRTPTIEAGSGGDDVIKDPPVFGVFPEGDDDDSRNRRVRDAHEQEMRELEAETRPESDYIRTYWMENVGQRVALGAAGVREEVQIDTGRQMAVRVAHRHGHRLGRMGLGVTAGRYQIPRR